MSLETLENVKLVVGLGNTGSEYRGTRHNIGFMLIDLLADEFKVTLNKSKFKSIYGLATIAGQPVILVKPKTGMNLSGSVVKRWMDFLEIELSSCLIIQDAADISLGNLKLKIGGNAGGQNGVKDIIQRTGNPNFARLKLGIGRPERQTTDLSNWVLGKFKSTDLQTVNALLNTAKACVKTWIEFGSAKAMCDFNSNTSEKPKKMSKKEEQASSSAPTILIPQLPINSCSQVPLIASTEILAQDG